MHMKWQQFQYRRLVLYNHVPQNSYIQVLTSDVTVFRDKAFREVIKVKWGRKDGALMR